MRNLALWVAFDGTDFHGWQAQPGQRTVQGVLEETLQRCLRHPVHLDGCGRTDAGVHAAAHVSNFSTNVTLPTDKLQHSFTARLPEDLSIIALRDMPPSFHAARSAISKMYRYRVHAAAGRPVELLSQRYLHHHWVPLDVTAMRLAARHLVGTRDFTSFASTGTKRQTMVRTIFRFEVYRHLDEIRFDVEGNGFLWRQVRTMVGTLIQVGTGRWKPEQIPQILKARDRACAGPTMPAKGLCLQWVRYPPELMGDCSASGNPLPQTDALAQEGSPTS